MYLLLTRHGASSACLQPVSGDGTVEGKPSVVTMEALPAAVRAAESAHPRWLWGDTQSWYPALLAAGVRVQRCHDLRLSRAILKRSVLCRKSALAAGPRDAWDEPAPANQTARGGSPASGTMVALFEDVPTEPAPVDSGEIAEFRQQQNAVTAAAEPGRLRLLLAAESAGALIAAEIHHAGLPFRSELHDRMLTEQAGPRPQPGSRPIKLEALADQVRQALGQADLNPDSHTDLLRALRRVGLVVSSTRSWELRELVHPAIEPLLAYKKLSRLLSANGWAWSDQWVSDGRFKPDYVVGGVVTGRWATDGGGALQLPKQVRGAVVADPGWKLVVADAAQLEPRVLAALAGDTMMSLAGRGTDLYAGIVASGAVAERSQAKVAMLGAMYGGTTGDSGRLLPRLARAFPRAIDYVDNAARAGERGEQVTSRLGRSSPFPADQWQQVQRRSREPDATLVDERRARSAARDWGRFTRNFVVQASAAEWALCWMAEVRRSQYQENGSRPFTEGPHLVFFLHDEVIVHTPADRAAETVEQLRAAAEAAGRLLFHNFPVDFPVNVSIVDAYSEAE